MKSIFVVCERQTEVSFVKNILVPYCLSQNMTLIQIRILIKNDKRLGGMYRGGMSNFQKADFTVNEFFVKAKH
ncbi:hypothetical protein DYQ05_00915 [Treponema pedis]|nr:hypothetical protein DYQ05_00915 [Treponema pedis]